MELNQYVKMGILQKGSVSALAAHLGIAANSVTDAKAHRRGLPNDACVKLARLLNVDAMDVIAASELATETKAEKREFWLSFVNPAKAARVAGMVIFWGIVTNFVTPSPAEAAPILKSTIYDICIMLSLAFFSCNQGFFSFGIKFFQIRLKTSDRSTIKARKLTAVQPQKFRIEPLIEQNRFVFRYLPIQAPTLCGLP